MKYTMLGFSQQIAADYGLDLNDLAILRWFVDFKESGNMRSMEIDGDVYYWVFYEKNIRRIIYNKIAKKRSPNDKKHILSHKNFKRISHKTKYIQLDF